MGIEYDLGEILCNTGIITGISFSLFSLVTALSITSDAREEYLMLRRNILVGEDHKNLVFGIFWWTDYVLEIDIKSG